MGYFNWHFKWPVMSLKMITVRISGIGNVMRSTSDIFIPGRFTGGL